MIAIKKMRIYSLFISQHRSKALSWRRYAAMGRNFGVSVPIYDGVMVY